MPQKKPIALRSEAIGEFRARYEDGYLPVLNIWLTGTCDLACPHCATDAGKADSNELNAKDWIGVIEQARELGTRTLSINGKGEPLLQKGFRKIIGAASENYMMTMLYTNGRSVNRRTANALFKENVDVILKMPSLVPEVYDMMSGVEGSYKKAFRGMEVLLEEGYPAASEQSDDILTRLSFEMILARPAKDSLPELLKYCSDRQIYPMVDSIVAGGRVLQNRSLDELRLSEGEEKELYRKFAKIFGYLPEGGYNSDCPIRLGIFIDNQGYVRADDNGNSCDMPYKNLVGNVMEEPLEALWERLKGMRKKDDASDEAAYGCMECFPKCPRMLQAENEYRSRLELD